MYNEEKNSLQCFKISKSFVIVVVWLFCMLCIGLMVFCFCFCFSCSEKNLFDFSCSYIIFFFAKDYGSVYLCSFITFYVLKILMGLISEAVVQRCSVKKCVLRNFTKFPGKHLCQSHFFDKVAGLRSPTLFKKRLWHRCFVAAS